jgi:hypothetical protein
LIACQIETEKFEEKNTPQGSLEISKWAIENNFPKGLRLIVDFKKETFTDFESSMLELKIGDSSRKIAPESDSENLDSNRIVFVIGGGRLNTWTEIDSGTVTITDKQGNETTFETGPFVYSDPRFTWKEKESDNLKVLFYGSELAVNPDNVLAEGEKLLKKFKVVPERKIRVVVYESRGDIDIALL